MSSDSSVWDGPVCVRRSGSIVVSDHDAGVLLAFTAQIRNVSTCLANLLSCYNAVDGSALHRLPANIADFAPIEATFALEQSPDLRGLFKPATWVGLKGFSRFIGESRSELEQLLGVQHRAGGVGSAEVARALEIATGAACFAKITLKDLIAIHRRLFREYDVAELSYHANLLDDVLQGKSPLLVNGVLEPVRTDFQLRDPRVHLNAEAFLSGSQRGEIVMVRNISAGGLGFDGAGNVSAGQAIEIRLALSGRRLTGRVAWKIGDKAGVEFTERLAQDDALLIN